MKQKGFTLLEILVSMAILGVIGWLATTILFTTLKSVSKSDVIREVKQNGDYAISVMEGMIRNAKRVEFVGSGDCSTGTACPASGVSGTCLKIVNSDDKTTIFYKQSVTVGSITVNKIASNSGSFLTNNNVTVVGELNFTCVKPATAPPLVTLKFNLSQAGTTTRAEEQALINFQTSVALRTY